MRAFQSGQILLSASAHSKGAADPPMNARASSERPMRGRQHRGLDRPQLQLRKCSKRGLADRMRAGVLGLGQSSGSAIWSAGGSCVFTPSPRRRDYGFSHGS